MVVVKLKGVLLFQLDIEWISETEVAESQPLMLGRPISAVDGLVLSDAVRFYSVTALFTL